MTEQWYEFAGGNWQQEVDVRDFILKNYRLYDGDDTFLVRQPKQLQNFGIK